MPDAMRIGYITSTYGRASDTFIRNEVRGLRQLGHEVTTFSIRRPDEDALASDDVKREQANTIYLLEQGVLELSIANLPLYGAGPGIEEWWRVSGHRSEYPDDFIAVVDKLLEQGS